MVSLGLSGVSWGHIPTLSWCSLTLGCFRPIPAQPLRSSRTAFDLSVMLSYSPLWVNSESYISFGSVFRRKRAQEIAHKVRCSSSRLRSRKAGHFLKGKNRSGPPFTHTFSLNRETQSGTETRFDDHVSTVTLLHHWRFYVTYLDAVHCTTILFQLNHFFIIEVEWRKFR